MIHGRGRNNPVILRSGEGPNWNFKLIIWVQKETHFDFSAWAVGTVQEHKLFLLNVDYRKRIFSILHYGENNELWTESLSVVKINSYINNLLVIKFCSVNSLEVLPSSFMYSHLNSQLVVSCSLSHWDINTKIISETALFATYLHHGTEPRIFSCSRRSSTALTAERKMREECVRPAISEMMEI